MILLSIALVNNAGHAQPAYPSKKGYFEVKEKAGCTPLTVEITSKVSCPCNLYFDGGSGLGVDGFISRGNNTFIHTYSKPGIYNLILVGTGLGRDSIEIVVFKNNPPQFTASSCKGQKADINITDTNYDSYKINYGDGTEISVQRGNNPATHTYVVPKSYPITIRGLKKDAKDNCLSNNTQTKVVVDLSNALIESLSLTSTTEADLIFTPDPNANVQYYLQIQTNSDNPVEFQKYLSAPLTTSPLKISDRNLDFDATFYCFRLATFDPCDNVITGYSNTLCSVDLDEVAVKHLSNYLNINASATTLIEHKILRSDLSKPRFSLTGRSTYIDKPVVCKTKYCYRIVSDYKIAPAKIATSTSLLRCATARSLNTPDPVVDISIDASSDPIISWSAPTGFTPDDYYIRTISSNAGEVTSIKSTSYTDTNTSLAPPCYRIGYVDECGKTADQSRRVCGIFLSKNTSDGVTTLRWTAFNGQSTGVAEYQLLKNGTETIYTGNNLSFKLPATQDVQKATYQVIAKANNGSLADAQSNVISITNRSNITFPNAFVANGINDKFKVVGRYIVNFDMKIYTRWGELIAHITDHDTGWDGTHNSRDVPEGNYIYSAEISDEAGNLHQRNGEVLLIRK